MKHIEIFHLKIIIFYSLNQSLHVCVMKAIVVSEAEQAGPVCTVGRASWLVLGSLQV